MKGTQSQLDFLPESHTDFIIAVLAEEHGLRGVLMLMGIYLLLLLRGFWIGVQAQTSFGRMMAGSITLTFFVYIFVNMGMVAGLLPVVGVPLPLVSAGGTSVVTLMAGFGILMAVSTEKPMVAR
jgi:rod shape determining protein RodA